MNCLRIYLSGKSDIHEYKKDTEKISALQKLNCILNMNDEEKFLIMIRMTLSQRISISYN